MRSRIAAARISSPNSVPQSVTRLLEVDDRRGAGVAAVDQPEEAVGVGLLKWQVSDLSQMSRWGRW
jgi:hypothetical protein